jgi:hypothetical protein
MCFLREKYVLGARNAENVTLVAAPQGMRSIRE